MIYFARNPNTEANPNVSGKESTSSATSTGSEGSTSSSEGSDIEGDIDIMVDNNAHREDSGLSMVSLKVHIHVYAPFNMGLLTAFPNH